MRWESLILGVFTSALAIACGKPDDAEKAALDPALAPHVLDAVPSDVEQRTLIDFGGKAHLVGYDLEPKGSVERGESVSLKMYWRSVSPLSDGWGLFTHVLDDRGKQVLNADNVGPLRRIESGEGGDLQALGPSRWQVGKVYVDEQELEIPANVESETVAIAVGIWKYAERTAPDGAALAPSDTRLVILGGKSDGENRGIVTRLSTDYRRPARVEETKPEPN